jgi:hypothetical protein
MEEVPGELGGDRQAGVSDQAGGWHLGGDRRLEVPAELKDDKLYDYLDHELDVHLSNKLNVHLGDKLDYYLDDELDVHLDNKLKDNMRPDSRRRPRLASAGLRPGLGRGDVPRGRTEPNH